MNLIEQLGGYERAKHEFEMIKEMKPIYPGEIETNDRLLLEYRRQHNIFEVGDQYVMLKLWHNDLITVEEGDMDQPWWNTRIIRHITDEEREAGYRLPD